MGGDALKAFQYRVYATRATGFAPPSNVGLCLVLAQGKINILVVLRVAKPKKNT